MLWGRECQPGASQERFGTELSRSCGGSIGVDQRRSWSIPRPETRDGIRIWFRERYYLEISPFDEDIDAMASGTDMAANLP